MGIGSFVLTRGIVSVIIGIVAFAWPGVTISALIGIFALYALLDGAMNLYLGLVRRLGRNPAWGQMLQGIAGILAGVVTFMWPGVTAQLLVFFIGTWAVFNGILQIVAAVRLRKIIRGEWLLAFGGAMSIVFGLVVISRPGVAMVGLSWSLGVYALLSGVLLIALGLRLREVSSRMALAARA
jgi:uncharacterized membrane protein HdeD (DUF308 family)